jgi:hypothetical protein
MVFMKYLFFPHFKLNFSKKKVPILHCSEKIFRPRTTFPVPLFPLSVDTFPLAPSPLFYLPQSSGVSLFLPFSLFPVSPPLSKSSSVILFWVWRVGFFKNFPADRGLRAGRTNLYIPGPSFTSCTYDRRPPPPGARVWGGG